MNDECTNPFCGTLSLMIGLSPVTLSVDDTAAARVTCIWHRERDIEGRGANLRDAVVDCCERGLERCEN